MIHNLFEIKSKKAIITGASRGLGLSIAEGLMEFEAETVIIAKTESVHQVAADFVSRGYKCKSVQCDLGNREDRQRGFSESVALLDNDLDILVNCAGIQRRFCSESFHIEDWDQVIEINLTAVFDYCQRAAKIMLSKHYGKIINIASLLSFFGGVKVPAYAASKGGISQITKAFSNEWASQGININAIAPGYMLTEMNTELSNPANPRFSEITGRIPQKRWGSPNDVKGCAIFLASHASDYVNGTIIPVDGGYLAM